MFKFKIPAGAMLRVQLPTGGEQLMMHMGEGEFVSEIPPLMLNLLSTTLEDAPEVQPVSWDSSMYGKAAVPMMARYDAVMAMDAVKAAAEGGDELAVAMLEKIAAGAEKLDAAQGPWTKPAVVAGS